jgi:hypothetical protein
VGRGRQQRPSASTGARGILMIPGSRSTDHTLHSQALSIRFLSRCMTQGEKQMAEAAENVERTRIGAAAIGGSPVSSIGADQSTSEWAMDACTNLCVIMDHAQNSGLTEILLLCFEIILRFS